MMNLINEAFECIKRIENLLKTVDERLQKKPEGESSSGEKSCNQKEHSELETPDPFPCGSDYVTRIEICFTAKDGTKFHSEKYKDQYNELCDLREQEKRVKESSVELWILSAERVNTSFWSTLNLCEKIKETAFRTEEEAEKAKEQYNKEEETENSGYRWYMEHFTTERAKLIKLERKIREYNEEAIIANKL